MTVNDGAPTAERCETLGHVLLVESVTRTEDGYQQVLRCSRCGEEMVENLTTAQKHQLDDEGGVPTGLGPMDTLTAEERRQILEVLTWLARMRSEDEVRDMIRFDALHRGGREFAGLSEEAWQLLAESAIESVILPVAIRVNKTE